MRNASTTIYTTGAAAKSDVVAPGGAPQLYPIGGSGCLLPSCNFDAEAESALRESIPGFMSVVVTAEAMTVEVWALAWDAEHGEESLAAAIAAPARRLHLEYTSTLPLPKKTKMEQEPAAAPAAATKKAASGGGGGAAAAVPKKKTP